VYLQLGKPEQPQNCEPADFPLPAVRNTICLPHLGQTGLFKLLYTLSICSLLIDESENTGLLSFLENVSISSLLSITVSYERMYGKSSCRVTTLYGITVLNWLLPTKTTTEWIKFCLIPNNF